MKSKAPLTLMEQIVMLLVFALAAALCLQMFVFTGQMSRKLETKDRAVTAVQNAAETVKAVRGNSEEYAEMLGATKANGVMTIGYDEKWNAATVEDAEYLITVTPQNTDESLLGAAKVAAERIDGEEIFHVIAAWQEVACE